MAGHTCEIDEALREVRGNGGGCGCRQHRSAAAAGGGAPRRQPHSSAAPPCPACPRARATSLTGASTHLQCHDHVSGGPQQQQQKQQQQQQMQVQLSNLGGCKLGCTRDDRTGGNAQPLRHTNQFTGFVVA